LHLLAEAGGLDRPGEVGEPAHRLQVERDGRIRVLPLTTADLGTNRR
jgi:hypothetical protein